MLKEPSAMAPGSDLDVAVRLVVLGAGTQSLSLPVLTRISHRIIKHFVASSFFDRPDFIEVEDEYAVADLGGGKGEGLVGADRETPAKVFGGDHVAAVFALFWPQPVYACPV